MELIDLSLSWVFVVSWVFAKDDFFKTSNSLSAPFVDLSVPVVVSEDKSLVVSVVFLVVSWVFAKDDFFKTSNSLSAPFVDLSVPVVVSEDKSLVVSVVF